MSSLIYGVAACQTDMPLPATRSEMKRNTDRILYLVDQAVTGYAPFEAVRLVVFPEFAHSGPSRLTARELSEHVAVPVPNEHTERLTEKAKQYGIYIQIGSMLEADARWPRAVFNTTCLVGPEGILAKYRKVCPWIPWEVHASPHDLEGYKEEIFPVARTPLGNLGVATCYDWLFPENLRQLTANGAEVLIRISAYMDPWGATPPMDWWTVVNRCRALENTAYVVAANQGASLKNYPPFSWPGGSMVVDFDGRVLAEAPPGPGEKIVFSTIDVGRLRHERSVRAGHQMLAHLRTELYPMYRKPFYPAGTLSRAEDCTPAMLEKTIHESKERLGYNRPESKPQALADVLGEEE